MLRKSCVKQPNYNACELSISMPTKSYENVSYSRFPRNNRYSLGSLPSVASKDGSMDDSASIGICDQASLGLKEDQGGINNHVPSTPLHGQKWCPVSTD